jgi:hypothetical protein
MKRKMLRTRLQFDFLLYLLLITDRVMKIMSNGEFDLEDTIGRWENGVYTY